MNEDIIRMAREAGWNEIGSDLWGATFDGAMSIYALSKFAELVRADEREACAKLFDDRDNGIGFYEPHEPAEIIRARGKE